MTENAQRALLPAGLRDILPPQAAHEADIVGRLMVSFESLGYERVKPPLIEFVDGLLADCGAATANHAFRVMDPISQRMMGLRADMTPQVARIATTRLANEARPLRLSYAGQVLRVKGGQLRPERQFGQAGIELIGAPSAAADAEIILAVALALKALGAKGISIDLTLPTLVPLVIAGHRTSQLRGEALRSALDHKDVAAVAAQGGPEAAVLTALIEAVGPARAALERLNGVTLPAGAARERDRLAEVVGLVAAAAPDLVLTIDPVENRGFEYHTGIGFTIFAQDSMAELGRGGRYDAHGETATGATLFMDTLLDVVPGPRPKRRIYLPAGTEFGTGERLRAEGWVTIGGLQPATDPAGEARRLGCGHVWSGGGIVGIE